MTGRPTDCTPTVSRGGAEVNRLHVMAWIGSRAPRTIDDPGREIVDTWRRFLR